MKSIIWIALDKYSYRKWVLLEAVMWNIANASVCEGTETRGIGEVRGAG